jgi:hypothetical protein
MATNGTNGKHHGGTKSSRSKTAASKPTPAQQRARKAFVERTGHKVTREQVEKIRSQWQG